MTFVLASARHDEKILTTGVQFAFAFGYLLRSKFDAKLKTGRPMKITVIAASTVNTSRHSIRNAMPVVADIDANVKVGTYLTIASFVLLL
jgi:hypothetical protein